MNIQYQFQEHNPPCGFIFARAKTWLQARSEPENQWKATAYEFFRSIQAFNALGMYFLARENVKPISKTFKNSSVEF